MAAALLLTPGAGTGADHPSLLAVETAVEPMPVERYDFGYRRAGRKSPPRADRLIGEIVDASAALAHKVGCERHEIVLGGRSMGGRVCSMAVAEGLPAAGLALICYPLHPPGKPEKLRVDHFGAIEVPCLFLSGTRDPFATPDELTHHTAAIPGAVTHRWVEGGRHDLRGADDTIAEAIVEWVSL